MTFTERFKNADIVSIKDFSREEIEFILDVAETMLPVARGEEKSKILDGKILATIFQEPSTRTRLSFETAMHRLGGSVIGFSGEEGTSLKKGETLADTIRMIDAYSDVIALRHPQEGAARLAAAFSGKPVLNGGDGAGQHPTQTLLDLFTIKQELGDIQGKTVTLLGDLKYGRTVHSLASALSLFDVRLNLVAPAELQMPDEITDTLEERDIRVHGELDLKEAVAGSDVLYVTRIQKERFPDPEEYNRVAGIYAVDPNVLSRAPDHLIVMHPLPRVNEIDPEVDGTRHAVYFRQAFNGVPVRMALLALVLGAIREVD